MNLIGALSKNGMAAAIAFCGISVDAQEALHLPLSDETRAEIHTILDAGEGQVRKWLEPPTIVVVYRNDRIPEMVNDAVAIIEEGRDNFFGYGEVTLLDLDDIDGDLFKRLDIGVRSNDLSFSWKTSGGILSVEGDIFVFALDLPEVLYVSALTRIEGRFTQGIARRSEYSCYYNVWSRDDILRFAGVYIRSDGSENSLRDCLYEELIQSLGLLNDAEGTEVFTLNDAREKIGKREADRTLLDALYAPSVVIGEATDSVIEYLENSEHIKD